MSCAHPGGIAELVLTRPRMNWMLTLGTASTTEA